MTLLMVNKISNSPTKFPIFDTEIGLSYPNSQTCVLLFFSLIYLFFLHLTSWPITLDYDLRDVCFSVE